MHDESTRTESRVEVSDQKMTVRSTVKGECIKRYRNVSKITYGGIEITESQTWEQLGISDDAMVIVETSVNMKMMEEATQIPFTPLFLSTSRTAYDLFFLVTLYTPL